MMIMRNTTGTIVVFCPVFLRCVNRFICGISPPLYATQCNVLKASYATICKVSCCRSHEKLYQTCTNRIAGKPGFRLSSPAPE